ncbi:MAG: helix-turn-helix transcriptional regulator [Mesorhizobium sp.]|nr:helix-turn-helix transcriptional regulator [Mesorhizobium sp.]
MAEISRLARLTAAGTIPEAIRRCRRVAHGVGVSGFALFFTGRGSGSAKLVPCFDEHFPGISQTTADLCANASDALSRHALHSALPALWSADAGAGSALPPFVVRLAPLSGDLDGIAFPVSAESGQSALFVFTGRALALSGEDVLHLHQLCFEMFAAIAALKSGSASSASTLSKRELECLRLTAAGRTSEDIARILGLSAHTANQYLTAAAAKLDAVNRMHAVAKAMRLGLID